MTTQTARGPGVPLLVGDPCLPARARTTLFHWTPEARLPAILREGLVPGSPRSASHGHVGGTPVRTCLADTVEDAWRWSGHLHGPEGRWVCLEVATDAARNAGPAWSDGHEWWVEEVVPPSALRVAADVEVTRLEPVISVPEGWQPTPTAACRTRPWPAGLVLCAEGRVLMQRRSESVDHPATWAFPCGTPLPWEASVDTAVREATEEHGGLDASRIEPVAVLRAGDSTFRYVAATYPAADPAALAVNWEATDAAWVDPADVHELDLHPGVRLDWQDLRKSLATQGVLP